MIQIINIDKSPVKNKRLRVILSDDSKYDFGLSGGSTYLDHKDEKKRLNYWKRHYSNNEEQKLIDKLIPSPALFSAYLLWGFHKTLDENIKYLNRLFANVK